MDITPYAVPPGRMIVEWFEYVETGDENYFNAIAKLLDKTSANFPGANWIVQFYAQQTDRMTIVSGIAVRAEKL